VEDEATKRSTVAQQRKLNCALSLFNEPTLSIEPGETVVIETQDAFSGGGQFTVSL